VKTIVILEVVTDDDWPWWQALGLPDPASWNMSDLPVPGRKDFPPDGQAFVSVVKEVVER
jgi:hypothetical protein